MIHGNDGNNQQQGGSQNQGQQNTGGLGNNSWGLKSLDGFGNLSRHMTSETLAQATASISEVIKSAEAAGQFPKNIDLHVLQVDRQVHSNLFLSSLVFMARDRASENSPLAYHTLLLEASNNKVENRVTSVVVNNMSTNVTTYLMTSDVFDTEYLKTINNIVVKETGVNNPINCSGQILPADFNLEDKVALRNLVINVIIPVFTELQRRRQSTPDLDLTKYNKDSQLTANISYHNKDKFDYAGLPVRNSIEIRLTGQSAQRQNNNTSLNTGDNQVLVSEVNGFLDLVWSPAQVQQQQQMYAPMQNQPTQKYLPRFVITRMENQLLTTIPAQLLALASAAALNSTNAWWQYYSPKPVQGKNAIDLNDIGATNIETGIIVDQANPAAKSRIDTKAISFTDQELGRLMSMSFNPGMIMSLDVSECGADTYLNEVFVEAALGNKEANKAIVDAANILTGGNFSRYYTLDKGDPVILGTEQIFLGYFINKDGQKQDIRTIDYLALLNIHGDKEPDIGDKYSSIWYGNEPNEIRMGRYVKLIENSVGGEVVFTGKGRRITFNVALFDSLQKGITACGLDIRLNNAGLGVNYLHQRAAFGNNQAVMVNNSQLFNVGMTQGNNTPNGFGYARPNRFV